MKSKSNLIVTILAVLVFGNLVMAQNNEGAEKEVEGKMARREKPSEQSKLTQTHCSLGLSQTITAGIIDNLAAPDDPTFNNTPFPITKAFDDQSINKIFAYSFPLKHYHPCQSKVCQANLLIRVCNSGRDLWINDKIYVGSTTGVVFTPSFFVGTIWNQNGSEAKQCKTLNIPLSPPPSLPFLDVVMQDDSTIDYMELILNY